MLRGIPRLNKHTQEKEEEGHTRTYLTPMYEYLIVNRKAIILSKGCSSIIQPPQSRKSILTTCL